MLCEGEAPRCLSRLVGTDVNAKALHRGMRKLHKLHEERETGETGTDRSTPSVQLVRCSLADLDAEQVGWAEVITLVEVVEHLDPPALRELGAALLGRCAPRVLIVTTPNKEYNLNMMARW